MKNLFRILTIILSVTALHSEAQSLKGTSVVIVDPTLPSVAVLLRQVHPASKIVYLDPAVNPLAFILSTVKAYAPVSSLHVISEGKPGQLMFSGAPVTTAMLEDHWEVLSTWKEQFSPHADVLLYGCEIAKGEVGVEFVKSLAVLTGLDVAASDNLTGSWRKGGDWFLEIKSGRIESQLAVSKKIIDQYPAVLRSSEVKNVKGRRSAKAVH